MRISKHIKVCIYKIMGSAPRKIYVSHGLPLPPETDSTGISQSSIGMLKLYANHLVDDGFSITYRWWEDEDANSPSEKTSTVVARRICDGIVESDILIVMIESVSYAYPEAFAEVGMALALRKPVIFLEIVKNKVIVNNSFYFMPGVIKVPTWGKMKVIVRDIFELKEY